MVLIYLNLVYRAQDWCRARAPELGEELMAKARLLVTEFSTFLSRVLFAHHSCSWQGWAHRLPIEDYTTRSWEGSGLCFCWSRTCTTLVGSPGSLNDINLLNFNPGFLGSLYQFRGVVEGLCYESTRDLGMGAFRVQLSMQSDWKIRNKKWILASKD